ncbi:hypothetical protein EYZ11_008102 [Aspergillus tanneri]|uniref:Probable beta-glucosidase btgE n=1 Tax=Aspergillus tanneri TaxID=1220188 RepID=A0A4S3JBE2_9EURO|nr:uncharacterized protein ATNIH1004_004338 [Aspergillus tanneri]KAA8648453.1 hypothetical protein ATNIH1004_004338 [Aspergillus tanneri]THC92436.1 hypothetical protein EYZ11_008102 [Aspergillus tanneri]
MKAAILATAAALAGTAMADIAHMRRHDALHHRRQPEPQPEQCGCTTEVVTLYGPPTLVPIAQPTSTPNPPPVAPPASESQTSTSSVITTLHSTSYTTKTVVVTPAVGPTSTPAKSEQPTTSSTPQVTLPTPGVTSFSSTGVFTIPATTITVYDTTTVCGATTTELPSGSQTFGGVTTIVKTATTVTCPYATVEPSGSTVTSVLRTTTYVCPSAGTYTIAPTTTYVPSSTVVVYPTPATFTPGTYTQDEQTVTVTRTDISYVCPFTGSNEPTSTPVPPSSTEVPVTPTAAPSTSSSSKPKTPVPTGASGKQMGMTYSPYTNGGQCKSKSEVSSDVAVIKQKGFTHVRVYSTDCNSLEFIGEAARKNGLLMIIGVFISNTGISGAQEQVTAITKWAQWELVSLIVVGNEAIQNGYCSASELAGFISAAKGKFQSAGYSGAVTTTEPINVWEQNGSALCGAVDKIGANIHPFFNAEVSPKDAGKFAKSQVKILEGICNGKEVVNLETGWPNGGVANGLAVPGASEQSAAIRSLVEEVGSFSVFFSYSNDLWKDAGEFDVERYWGCIDQF